MFYNSVVKETKGILKSISFYMMLVVLIIMYLTQFSPPNIYNPLEPIPNYQDQETTSMLADEKNEMGYAYKRMLYDLKYGITAKYTGNSVRWTKLTQEQKIVLEKAKSQLAEKNISYQEFITLLDSVDKTLKENTVYNYVIRKYIISDTYYGNKIEEDSKYKFDELDQKLGKKYIFSEEKMGYLYRTPKTYDDALDEFKDIINKDKLTNAYARLLADYMGITAGFYPVFIILSLFIREKKKKTNESKNRIIDLLAKYTAACLCVFLPYMIIATHTTYIFYNIGKTYGYTVDVFAFYKYMLLWIGPTILFVISLSMMVYKIFKKIIITISIQFVLWGIAVSTLIGDYRLFRYIIRFNELGAYESYMNWKESIIINRVFFTIVSFVILGITLFIKESKKVDTINR